MGAKSNSVQDAAQVAQTWMQQRAMRHAGERLSKNDLTSLREKLTRGGFHKQAQLDDDPLRSWFTQVSQRFNKKAVKRDALKKTQKKYDLSRSTDDPSKRAPQEPITQTLGMTEVQRSDIELSDAEFNIAHREDADVLLPESTQSWPPEGKNRQQTAQILRNVIESWERYWVVTAQPESQTVSLKSEEELNADQTGESPGKAPRSGPKSTAQFSRADLMRQLGSKKGSFQSGVAASKGSALSKPESEASPPPR